MAKRTLERTTRLRVVLSPTVLLRAALLRATLLRGTLPRTVLLLAVAAISACGVPGGAGEDGLLTRWGDDLLAIGPESRVIGDVEGDVMMAGPSLLYEGTAGGDFLGAGGRILIGGAVDGDVRAAGGEVLVEGQAGGNATLAGGRVRLGSESIVEGNVYLAGGQLDLSGRIGGHVRAAGGEVTVNGSVDGDLAVDARRLRLGPGARVAGELQHRVHEEEVSIDPAAVVEGGIVPLPPRAPTAPSWSWMGLRVLWGLGFLLTGVIVALLLPRTAHGAAAALARKPGRSVGFGLLWLVVVPVAMLVAAATLVGLPLAVVLFAAFLVLAYLGRIFPAIWLGRAILRGEWELRRRHLVGAFLLGGVILVILGLMPVVGPIVSLLATLVGVGALLTALVERPRESIATPPPTVPRPTPGEG